MSIDNNRRIHAQAIRARHRAHFRSRLGLTLGMLAISTLMGAVALGYTSTTIELKQEAGTYAVAWVEAKALNPWPADPKFNIPYQGQLYRAGVKEIAASEALQNDTLGFVEILGIGGVLGFGSGCVGLWLIAFIRRRRQGALLADRVITGTRIVTDKELARMTARECGPHPLCLGRVPIPTALETRHFAMLGTTGAGKTTALRQILDAIEARGEAALVYDTSGEFIAHYYDPERGDVILNPFDERGVYWNPFDEISHPADADRIARYLITESGDRDRDVWLDTARILVANMLRTLWQEGKRTPQALLDVLQSMPREKLEQWLAHTSSARTFAEDADRATGSVLFMLAKAANLLMFLKVGTDSGEEGFSFARFFKEIDRRQGLRPWIFVPRKEDYFEAVKPLMALWLECAASATLGLLPLPSRRLWFILDEIADLPRVDNLARLLPEGRKFGAGVILTFQAIGQMRDRYGSDGAEAMLGCCNSKLFLQLVDQASREWASDTIGQVEVEISTLSDSIDHQTGKPDRNLSSTRQVRAAVLESELRLPKHTAYLLLPDGLPVAKITLTDDHIHAHGPAHQPRYLPVDLNQTLWGGLRPATKGTDSRPSLPVGPGPV